MPVRVGTGTDKIDANAAKYTKPSTAPQPDFKIESLIQQVREAGLTEAAAEFDRLYRLTQQPTRSKRADRSGGKRKKHGMSRGQYWAQRRAKERQAQQAPSLKKD